MNHLAARALAKFISATTPKDLRFLRFVKVALETGQKIQEPRWYQDRGQVIPRRRRRRWKGWMQQQRERGLR